MRGSLPFYALSLVLLPAVFCGAARGADETAVAHVEALYAGEWPGKDARYSARILALWEACESRPDAEEEPCLDFDFFVMAQDYDLTDFKLEPLSDDGRIARVKASFVNLGRPTEVVFDLVHDGDGWTIDEMTSGCETLSGLLKREPPAC